MENMQKAQLNDTPDINVDLAENELDDILKRSFRPRTDEASATVRRAIGTLAAYANKGQVKVNRDVVLTIESLVAEIDEKLSDQMNLILHHKEFQKLESAWRGLSYLVDNTDANETLKIRVLNISQDELGKRFAVIVALHGIKVRYLNRSMNMNMGSLVGNLLVA